VVRTLDLRHRHSSGITTYGLMALGREMSTPPIPSRSMAHFTFLIQVANIVAPE